MVQDKPSFPYVNSLIDYKVGRYEHIVWSEFMTMGFELCMSGRVTRHRLAAAEFFRIAALCQHNADGAKVMIHCVRKLLTGGGRGRRGDIDSRQQRV